MNSALLCVLCWPLSTYSPQLTVASRLHLVAEEGPAQVAPEPTKTSEDEAKPATARPWVWAGGMFLASGGALALAYNQGLSPKRLAIDALVGTGLAAVLGGGFALLA